MSGSTPNVQELRDEIAAIYGRFAGATFGPHPATREFLSKILASMNAAKDDRALAIALSAYQTRPDLFPSSGPLSKYASGMNQKSAPLTPAFAKLPRARQARLVLGARPIEIIEGLTAKEAHEACVLGYVVPIPYLLRDVQRLYGACTARTVLVARWVAACMGDTPRRDALLLRHDDGHIGGRLFDRIDEIMGVDLVRGISTGVQAAFDSARERGVDLRRREDAQNAQNAIDIGNDTKQLAKPPPWFVPIRCARILDTRTLLRIEGKAMSHCVGGYYSWRVEDESSVILSIRVPTRGQFTAHDYTTYAASDDPKAFRSTVEYHYNGGIVQHRGPKNVTPHVLCIAALRYCEKKWFGKSFIPFQKIKLPRLRSQQLPQPPQLPQPSQFPQAQLPSIMRRQR